jgi:hypothetical protein
MLLTERGVRFENSATPITNTQLSKWNGEKGSRERYSVRVTPASEGRSRLYVHHLTEEKVAVYAPEDREKMWDPNVPMPQPIGHRYQTHRRRDLGVEWEVLQRLEPVRAIEIEEIALERERVVRDVVANGFM